jgi:Tfp pilus assembly protein PilF
MKKWQAYLLVALLVAGIYGRTVTFGYIELDDTLLIVDGQSFLQDLSNVPAAFRTDVFDVRLHSSSAMYYRPLLVVTLMLDAQLGGTSPVVYHVTNILLHVLACWAILTLLTALGHGLEWSLFATLVFAAHPALVQAVAWIPGRNDSLLALFVVLSFLLLMRFLDDEPGTGRIPEGRGDCDSAASEEQPEKPGGKPPPHDFAGASRRAAPRRLSWTSYAGHLGLFLLALFTKETAVFFLLVAAFYLLFVRRRSWNGREALALTVGWIIVCVVWVLARHAALADRQADVALSSLGDNAITNFPIFIAYIGKALLPLELSVWHSPADTSLVYGLVSLVALGGLVFISKEARRSYVALGSLWFAVFLLPSLVVPILTGMEHRLYLPLVGLMVVFFETDLLRQVDLRKRANAAVATLLVLGLAAFSFQRSGSFADKQAFWESAIRTSPSSALAHLNLGATYIDQDRLVEAEREFIRTLELNPVERMAHNNLGIVYARSGLLEEAGAELARELELYPTYADGYFNLGTLKMQMGEEEEAIRLWERVLELNPQNVNAYASLARYFLSRNEPARAAPYIERLQEMGVDVSSLLVLQ